MMEANAVNQNTLKNETFTLLVEQLACTLLLAFALFIKSYLFISKRRKVKRAAKIIRRPRISYKRVAAQCLLDTFCGRAAWFSRYPKQLFFRFAITLAIFYQLFNMKFWAIQVKNSQVI
jgi:hypothetical protein